MVVSVGPRQRRRDSQGEATADRLPGGGTRERKENDEMILEDNRLDSAIDGRGWWAIYTKHQHEKRVAEMISARGGEVFLPVYQGIRRWSDRNVTLTLPLFPSYVFVREDPSVRLSILSTPGVHMILIHGEKYAVISALEIANLQRAVAGERGVEPHPFLKAGERVRVVRGALEGVEGVLLRQKNLCRVVISVEMLAQAVAIEVSAWEIEPASPAQRMAPMAAHAIAHTGHVLVPGEQTA